MGGFIPCASVMTVTVAEVFWRDTQVGRKGRHQDMSRSRSISQKALKWILIAFAAAAALQIYYVQEILAALILLAVLFSGVATVLLILFVLERAGEALLEVLELSAKHALQQAREWRTLP